MKKYLLLTLLIATVYLLHHDCWNWKRIEPLVFGFLPVGLAYHVGYSLFAALFWKLVAGWLLTKPPGRKTLDKYFPVSSETTIPVTANTQSC